MRRNHGIQALSSLIVLLALTALSCQSTGFNPFATVTPSPTLTFTPTATFTLAPSPTATVTSTPTFTPPPTGISVEKQVDGTSLVIDYDNQYQILLPPNWIVVFSSQKDFEEALQATSAHNPEFAQITESLKDVDPSIFRLAAANADRNYVNAGPILLTMNAYADPVSSSMPMAFVIAMIEDNILAGATSTTWDVVNNAHQVEVGIVRGDRTLQLPDGPSLFVQELVISFQANSKLIIMEIVAPKEFGDQLLAPFNNIIDSIKVGIS